MNPNEATVRFRSQCPWKWTFCDIINLNFSPNQTETQHDYFKVSDEVWGEIAFESGEQVKNFPIGTHFREVYFCVHSDWLQKNMDAARIAQSREHSPYKRWVQGSSPCLAAFFSRPVNLWHFAPNLGLVIEVLVWQHVPVTIIL